MKRNILAVMGSIILVLSLAVNLWAAAFTISFSDIELDNIQPGMPVSLLQKANFALSVTNTDIRSENMRFEVLAPEKDQLKEGFEPIPDVNWFKFESNDFWLKPNQTMDLDMVIYAPYDRKLFGKKYQALLVTYTMDGMLKVNLKSRILLSFTNERFSPNDLAQRMAEDTINNTFLIMSPKYLSLEKVRLNKDLNLGNFLVTNSSSKKVNLSFYVIGLENMPPVAGLVTFKQPNLELTSKETKKLELGVRFPLLRAKSSERMLILIGAKDTQMIRGQIMVLDLTFR